MEDLTITKNVVFEPLDHRIVSRVVKERGLGSRGFSAGLRMIIREWDKDHPPVADESEENDDEQA